MHCLPHPFPFVHLPYDVTVVFHHVLSPSPFPFVHLPYFTMVLKQGVKAFVSALPSKGLVLIILKWFNHEVMQKTLKSLYKT